LSATPSESQPPEPAADAAADAYTGEVYVGGPVDVRQLPGLLIAKLAVGKMSNNAYLLRDAATGDALLIDAADEPEKLLALAMLGAPDHTDSQLRWIVTTHQHFDHVGALAALVAASGASTAAGAPDAPELPAPVDRPLEHGDTIQLGDSALEVIQLRGHTPGSVALLYRDPSGDAHLFTGDSLFPGGVGKTWAEPDFDSLIDDVERRIFDVLPDGTWFYPGHGNDSTLGAERPHLAEWRARRW
jgi:glyoxylase-like metal-dependent hydrolase (beta-lactamase superfamily II)